ncbi:T9SS type A sorting domain-containing protein [Pontibacter arcticus]|nr:T9SS type A sorting domain-containing protein [Pontibacter arcticus]
MERTFTLFSQINVAYFRKTLLLLFVVICSFYGESAFAQKGGGGCVEVSITGEAPSYQGCGAEVIFRGSIPWGQIKDFTNVYLTWNLDGDNISTERITKDNVSFSKAIPVNNGSVVKVTLSYYYNSNNNFCNSTVFTFTKVVFEKPAIQNVIGAGDVLPYCPALSGAPIWIEDSETNAVYSFRNAAGIESAVVQGTGEALLVGYAPAGTYSVLARRSAMACSETLATLDVVALSPDAKLDELGNMYINKPALVAGDPIIFTAVSNINEGATFAWYTSLDGIKWIPVSETTNRLTYNSLPNDVKAVKCEVTPSGSSCMADTPEFLELSTLNAFPFPVEIIYLQASKQKKNVLLKWATAMEKDNAGFEVQVSETGTDFRKLAYVATKNGNSYIKQEYTFIDTENGKYGTRYYRLKQIDTDGTTAYFGPKDVSFDEVATNLSVFPNPFEKEISLEVQANAASKMQVTVSDGMGRIVLQKEIPVVQGSGLYKIETETALPAGLYFVNTTLASEQKSFKLIKR